jgi:hypothetical protein
MYIADLLEAFFTDKPPLKWKDGKEVEKQEQLKR